jgi:hypothetical protein
MKCKTLSKVECADIMAEWENEFQFTYDNEYLSLRTKLIGEFNKALASLNISKEQIEKNKYKFDLAFGLRLYEVLNECGFNLRNASNDGIWRFLSLRVIPDIIYYRWKAAPDHYWRMSRRIWIKSLWWYIHLSWQNNEQKTYEVLEGNTTDEIQNRSERPGANGYRVNLYRTIMSYYGKLSESQKKRGPNIFRRAMKLNTARLKVVEPTLVKDGELGYVKELFKNFVQEQSI